MTSTAFTGLRTDVLAASAFVANTTGLASDALDRIIYQITTGRLYFDADGAGSDAAVQFAVIDSGSSAINADFFLI